MTLWGGLGAHKLGRLVLLALAVTALPTCGLRFSQTGDGAPGKPRLGRINKKWCGNSAIALPRGLGFRNCSMGRHMTINLTPVEWRGGELKGMMLPILLRGLLLVTLGMISLFLTTG
jgi:hypothetical protein